MKWNEIMKYTFRLVPCSIYDYEIMESWLEDLALQGLVLENISHGIAKFRKQKMQNIRYRLTVIPAERMDVYEWIPGKSELISLCEAAGWKYICQRGQFGIFVTTDETVEELHTEPGLQHMDYKGYVNWWSLSGYTFMFLSFCYLFWSSFIRYGFFVTWAQQGSHIFLTLLAMMAGNFLMLIRQWMCPVVLYRKLKQEGISHEKKPWRIHALGYRIVMVALILLYTVGFGSVLCSIAAGHDYYDYEEWPQAALMEYQESLPLATMDDAMRSMFSDAVPLENERDARVVTEKRFIAPVMCIMDAEGSYQISDGTRVQCNTIIEYYETRSPWIAQQMAKEQYKCDQRLKWYHSEETPELGVEYAVAYNAFWPTILLVEDNKYVKIQLSTTADAYYKQVKPWCYVYAESLK